jgi:hypothetical protein
VVADIAKLSVGREEYYTRELATDHEQYLSGHGESPGRWYGAGAASLGLQGEALSAGFQAMFEGLLLVVRCSVLGLEGLAADAAGDRPGVVPHGSDPERPGAAGSPNDAAWEAPRRSPASLVLLGDLGEPAPGRRRRVDRRGDQLDDGRVRKPPLSFLVPAMPRGEPPLGPIG